MAETIIDIEPDVSTGGPPVQASKAAPIRPLIPPGLCLGLSLGFVAGVVFMVYINRRRGPYG